VLPEALVWEPLLERAFPVASVLASLAVPVLAPPPGLAFPVAPVSLVAPVFLAALVLGPAHLEQLHLRLPALLPSSSFRPDQECVLWRSSSMSSN
jgi:hypothetical protein